MKPVRQDADGAARVPERDLRDGDGEIQNENAKENTRDRGVTRRHGLL